MKNRRARDLDALQDPALAPLQAALTADAAADELKGERDALIAFRAVSWDRKPRWHAPAVFATKLGVATVAGVLGLSGVATAAYTGSLPDTLQNVAHKTIKAPAAGSHSNGKGPDASGDAAWGLCQAFGRDKGKDDEAKQAEKAAERAAERAAEGGSPKATPPGQLKKQETPGRGNGKPDGVGPDGDKAKKSVAYRNLVRAAGGEDKVEAYCATVPKPSGEPEASQPSAKPSKSAGKPTAKPTQAATGKPTELPAPAESHPTGSPSPLPTGSPETLPTP